MKTVTRQTGTVSDIDEKTAQVRVSLPECDNLRTHWLQVLQRNTQNNKDYWLPDIGEQVEVLLDENGEDGIVLGAVYSSVDAPPVASLDKRYVQFSDQAMFDYDRTTHRLTINGGIKEIVIVADINITGNVDIRGDVSIIGDMSVKGDVGIVGDTSFLGMVDIKGNTDIVGNLATTGNVVVAGNIEAAGSVMDAGGNTNHHSH